MDGITASLPASESHGPPSAEHPFLVCPEVLEPLAGAARALMETGSPGISHDERTSYLISGPEDSAWVSIQA